MGTRLDGVDFGNERQLDGELGYDGMDDAYYDDGQQRAERTGFGAELLREPVTVLPSRTPLCFSASDSATDAMRAMQREHRGCVLITEDGTLRSPVSGIFTERDVVLRIIDRGRHPAAIALSEVMTSDPESLPADAPIAWVLNMMSVGGFRHVPVVDEAGQPVFIASVRAVVQYLVEHFPGEVLNLPPEFGARRYQKRDGA